jgi:hypothetical protein
MSRCQGTTKVGRQCKLPALKGKKFCHHHLPRNSIREETQDDQPNNLGPSLRRQIILKTLRGTKQQLVIVGLVFTITAVLSRDGGLLINLVWIPNEVAIQFFSSTSEALGAFLALMIAVLFFSLEGTEQARSNSYQQFKFEIRQLNQFALTRPDELSTLDAYIDFLVNYLAFVQKEDLPSIAHAASIPKKAMATLAEEALELKEELSREGQFYLNDLLIGLRNLEETLYRMYIQMIAVVGGGILLSVTIKIAVLLGLCLMLLLAFGTIDERGILPDFGLAVIFAIVAWLFLMIFEVLSWLKQLYGDLYSEYLKT